MKMHPDEETEAEGFEEEEDKEGDDPIDSETE